MLLMMALICFFCSWNIYISNRRIVNIKSVVLMVWGIVLLVNYISPYDWNPMHDNTILILCVGTIVMNLTFLLTQRFTPKKKSINILPLINTKSLNKVYFLQIAIIVITLPINIKAVNLLVTHGFDMTILRTMYATGGGGLYMTTLQRLFYIHYVVQPLSYCCIAIDSYMCFMNGFDKKPLVYMILSMLNVSLYTAGRHVILYSIVAISVAYFQTKNNDIDTRMKKYKKKNYRKMIVLAGVATALITVLRSNEEGFIGPIIKSIVSYFCGGSMVLDTILQEKTLYGFSSLSYGLCFIGGLATAFSFIDRTVFGALNLNLIPKDFSVYDIVQGYLNSSIRFGKTSAMNAFPTMYYYFLRDFDIIGIVLLTFLMCIIFSYFENRYYRKPSILNAVLYIQFFHTGIMSVCWFEPIRVEFWMTIFWIIIVNKMLFSNRLRIKFKCK